VQSLPGDQARVRLTISVDPSRPAPNIQFDRSLLVISDQTGEPSRQSNRLTVERQVGVTRGVKNDLRLGASAADSHTYVVIPQFFADAPSRLIRDG
jgi:hypothetical protein